MIEAAFILTTLLSLVLFYNGTGRDKRVFYVSLCWLLATGVAAYAGFFLNTDARPPMAVFVIIPAILLCIFFYRIINKSAVGTKTLLIVHALRVPVELVLYQLYLRKQVPIFMTFKGWNYDIVVGISAILILGYLLLMKDRISRGFMLVWNITGIVFLGIIVSIAALSAPLPFQQLAFDQPNTAVLRFPFVWLPAYVVPVVLLSHLLLMRKQG